MIPEPTLEPIEHGLAIVDRVHQSNPLDQLPGEEAASRAQIGRDVIGFGLRFAEHYFPKFLE